MLNAFMGWILDSRAREFAVWALSTIPGFPPLIQSVHLLSIAAIMASAVFLSLRVLGLAVRSQCPQEMAVRLQYWALSGVVGAFCSGVFFLLARPNRYLHNPVFQIKFTLLLPALICTGLLLYFVSNKPVERFSLTMKSLSLATCLLWIGVAMAGRWIAYSEYLFWSEH